MSFHAHTACAFCAQAFALDPTAHAAARCSGASDLNVMSRIKRCVMISVAATLAAATGAQAQDAEPRLYSNTPVGLNFLIAGYIYSQGKLAFDPSLPIADAQFRAHTGAVAYVRSFDLFGLSAKADVIVPFSGFSADGLVAGRFQERNITGLGDPRFRVSVNLFGAPALSLKEFANYRHDLVVGATLQVSAPLGQYDNARLLNLGGNRWSFRPEIGISKAWGTWTFELAPSVTFFTANPDFASGKRFAQAPLFLVRGSIIHSFSNGMWASLDGSYFRGGRTTVDGVPGDNEQENIRAGVTLAFPVNRQNSIKFNASTGLYTRTGSDFTLVGVAWQYRWGGGY
jgi:hypothetical protein